MKRTRRGGARVRWTVGAAAVAAALVLGGCGLETDEPSLELMREPNGGALVSPPPEWGEARDYTYRLESRCGECSLFGAFRVTVRDGRVSDWEPVGENYTSRSAEVPSIGGLLAQAEQAREDDADVVEVLRGADGRPTSVSIDYETRAIDDEFAYEITDYQPESAAAR